MRSASTSRNGSATRRSTRKPGSPSASCAEALSQEDAQALLRQVYEHVWRSPREPYRAYQQRLGQYNCAFAAQVHNDMTPEQRRRAIAKLKGWEDDLRALAAGS